MKQVFVVTLAALLSCGMMQTAEASHAQDNDTVIFSRAVIRFLPKPGKAQPEKPPETSAAKGREENKPTEILPRLPRTAKEFTVETRTLSFLAQRDFIAHQPFTDNSGLLIPISPARNVTLHAANILGKVDVLFLNDDGVVTRIAPDLVLSHMEEPIPSDGPVRALVFLKGGMCRSHDISPGDRAESPLFKQHPVVLE